MKRRSISSNHSRLPGAIDNVPCQSYVIGLLFHHSWLALCASVKISNIVPPAVLSYLALAFDRRISVKAQSPRTVRCFAEKYYVLPLLPRRRQCPLGTSYLA